VKVFESFDAASGAYRLRPPSRPVTVRHILTHTSGLGYPFTSAIVRDFKPRPGEDYPSGRCCSIRASAGITAPAPMRSDGWSRKSPASRSKTISASASLPR
jgi:CubicO group peptidase (beta-lactamase class C family)